MRGISLNPDQGASQNLASNPLSFTAVYNKSYKLEQVIFHFSVAVSETVTITLLSGLGTAYNTVLQQVVLSNQTDLVWRPQGEANFLAVDEIKVQCTNGGGVGTVGCIVKTSGLGSGR